MPVTPKLGKMGVFFNVYPFPPSLKIPGGKAKAVSYLECRHGLPEKWKNDAIWIHFAENINVRRLVATSTKNWCNLVHFKVIKYYLNNCLKISMFIATTTKKARPPWPSLNTLIYRTIIFDNYMHYFQPN